MPKNLTARGLKGESSSKGNRAAKQDKVEGRGNKEGHATNLDRQDRRDDVGDQQQNMRWIRGAQGSKSKSGCFPKLFVMLLPFMTFGSYLFLRS